MAFSEEERLVSSPFLETNGSATTVEISSAHEAAVGAEERLTLLTEAVLSLIGSLQPEDEMLGSILKVSQRLIAADAYAVWTRSTATGEWRIVHAVGLSEEYRQVGVPVATAMPPPIETPLAIENVFDKGRSVAEEDSLATRRESYRREGIQAILIIPLRIHGENSGTITFYYRVARRFTPVEIALAGALASLSASALRTAELYKSAQESRERYQALSELTSDYAYSCRFGSDGRVVMEWISEHFSRVTGYTLDEINRDGWESLLPLEDVPQVQQGVFQMLTGQDCRVEHRIITRSGEVQWLESYNHPLFAANPSGEKAAPVGFYGAARNVTERKRAEEALRASAHALHRSESELRYLAAHVRCLLWQGTVVDTQDPSGFFWWDTNVLDESAAQAFFPLHILPGERYTDAWYRVRLPEGKALTDRLSSDSLKSGQADYQAEFGSRTPDGEVRWFSERVYAEPLEPFDPGPDETGAPRGPWRRWRVVGVCTDITERKRAEDQEREREARQRAFVREVLFSVSEGKLRLCERTEELPPELPPCGEAITLRQETLINLRRQVRVASELTEFSEERGLDLLTAAGEAAMNAVVHAGGGEARVGTDTQNGVVQVWVTDQGGGINVQTLHRATLERGYTTAGSLGHGFWLMLKTADRIYLLTGDDGTTVVLEQDRYALEPEWPIDIAALA